MKYIFLLIAISFSCLFAVSQPTRDQHPLSQIAANTSVYVIEKDNYGTIVNGSTYYSEDFTNGWILLKTSPDTIQNLRLRYNIYHNILEWGQPQNEIKTLLIEPIASFGLGDEIFIPAKYFDSSNEGFYKTIYRGEQISAYSKISIKRKDIKANPPFTEKNSIIFYENIESYLLKEQTLHPINTKKDLSGLLNDWNIKSISFKKSDLKDEVFLQSLGEKIETALSNE